VTREVVFYADHEKIIKYAHLLYFDKYFRSEFNLIRTTLLLTTTIKHQCELGQFSRSFSFCISPLCYPHFLCSIQLLYLPALIHLNRLVGNKFTIWPTMYVNLQAHLPVWDTPNHESFRTSKFSYLLC